MKAPCLDCGTPTEGSRCPTCAGNRITNYTPKANTTQRGYGSDWQAIRRNILDRDKWTCALCGIPLDKTNATVDHILPLATHPHLRLDPTNLQAACNKCNSSKGKRR